MTLAQNIEKLENGVIDFIKNQKQKIIDELLKHATLLQNEIKDMVDSEIDKGGEAIVSELSHMENDTSPVDANNGSTTVPVHEEM